MAYEILLSVRLPMHPQDTLQNVHVCNCTFLFQVLFQFTKPLVDEKVERCSTSHKVTATAQLPSRHGAAQRWLRMSVVIQKLQSLYRMVFFHHKTRIFVRMMILLFFIYCFVSASSYQGVNKGSGIFSLWLALLNAWRAFINPA